MADYARQRHLEAIRRAQARSNTGSAPNAYTATATPVSPGTLQNNVPIATARPVSSSPSYNYAGGRTVAPAPTNMSAMERHKILVERHRAGSAPTSGGQSYQPSAPPTQVLTHQQRIESLKKAQAEAMAAQARRAQEEIKKRQEYEEQKKKEEEAARAAWQRQEAERRQRQAAEEEAARIRFEQQEAERRRRQALEDARRREEEAERARRAAEEAEWKRVEAEIAAKKAREEEERKRKERIEAERRRLAELKAAEARRQAERKAAEERRLKERKAEEERQRILEEIRQTEQARSFLQTKLQFRLKKMFEEAEETMAGDTRDESKLESGEAVIVSQLDELRSIKALLLEQNEFVDGKIDEAMDQITREEERGEPDVDDLVIPSDLWSHQMLEINSELNAINDCLYFFDKAIISGSIDVHMLLKGTKELASRQFFLRAHLNKIVDAKRKYSEEY